VKWGFRSYIGIQSVEATGRLELRIRRFDGRFREYPDRRSMDAQLPSGAAGRWGRSTQPRPSVRRLLALAVALTALALGGAVHAVAGSYPLLSCTAGTFVSSNSSAQAQQLLPQALAYCAEYNQVMGLLNQAQTEGCLSSGDLSQLDSLVAKTSAFERSYGTIFVTELDSWYVSQAEAITACSASGSAGSGGPTPLSLTIAGAAAVVVIGGVTLAVRANRRRFAPAGGGQGTGWTTAAASSGLQGPGIPVASPPTSGLQGPGIPIAPPPTAGLQGPGIPQPGLPPFIGAVPGGVPLGGAGASVAPPEKPAAGDLRLAWGADGRPILSWLPPQLDPSQWQLSGYTLYQFQFSGASTAPQPTAIATLPPGSTTVGINWTAANQTYTFSTGGDVAGWGVQPVFNVTGGQFAGTVVHGPLSWVATGG